MANEKPSARIESERLSCPNCPRYCRDCACECHDGAAPLIEDEPVTAAWARYYLAKVRS